jgi:type IX secretion system PorP/SprF family membrane protein
MKKILLSIVIFISLSNLVVKAQDEAVFSHYTVNPLLINPAATGFSEKHQLFMNLRNTWTGFPGAPSTYALSYNGPVSDRLGIGAQILSENIAAFSRLRAQLSYAFRYNIADFKMGIGISTEFHRLRVDKELYDNPFTDQGDTDLNTLVDGVTFFDASLGFWGRYLDNFTVGLALPNLVRTKIGEIGDDAPSTALKHYIFYSAYRYQGDEFAIEPSLQVRKVMNTPFQVDLNLRAFFIEGKLIGGLTYRPGVEGGMMFMAGTKSGAFQAFYSYDISFSTFQRYNGGSHEITIGFEFDRNPKQFDRDQKYRN